MDALYTVSMFYAEKRHYQLLQTISQLFTMYTAVNEVSLK